ncbi:unnamed protein product [Moneuplotes crassus]|uniref:Uncharacterized protein n=1 Tax=Euplotes crassus TaxID=5936 RepID=A0AAD1X6C7_EUPCR|nr:unnamed protein product [Moneuplotes crassus]
MNNGRQLQSSPNLEVPYNTEKDMKPNSISRDLAMKRKVYSNPLSRHMRSKSDVNMRVKRPQQAELRRSQIPQVKKAYNFSPSAKKSMTPSAKVLHNNQSGGFSYDNFYDSLKELNEENNGRSNLINLRSSTITQNSSPKISQKSPKHVKPPLNPAIKKNITPVLTLKENKVIPSYFKPKDFDKDLTPGFNPVTKSKSTVGVSPNKPARNLSQSVLMGLMTKSFSKPKERNDTIKKSDVRMSADNLIKFNLNPFRANENKIEEEKVAPTQKRKEKFRNGPTISFKDSSIKNPETIKENEAPKVPIKSPDRTFKLAQKIFSRKVIRKDKLKKHLDTKKLADFKECITTFKTRCSKTPMAPIKKKGFRHKKYTEAYLQNCLTHLKVIKALCVALETDKHKTFGPL